MITAASAGIAVVVVGLLGLTGGGASGGASGRTAQRPSGSRSWDDDAGTIDRPTCWTAKTGGRQVPPSDDPKFSTGCPGGTWADKGLGIRIYQVGSWKELGKMLAQAFASVFA